MNNEEKILTMLETIIAEQQQTNHRLDKLETKVEKLETKVEKLDFKIDKLDSGVGNMEADITETKHRVIIIENEHGQKLGALFDSYQLLYEVSGEIRSGIGSIQAAQENRILISNGSMRQTKKQANTAINIAGGILNEKTLRRPIPNIRAV